MKHRYMICLVLLVFVFLSTDVFAGSIDWLSQQSAEYIRTLSRNAALEGADIVNYNPAGTAFLADGFHVQLGEYTLLKFYDIEYEGRTYESNEPSAVVPYLYGIYKKNNYAAFASFTVPAGGGTVKYDDGIPYMPLNEPAIAAVAGVPASFVTWKRGFMEGSSMYLAGTIGGSYAFNDMFSVSLAVRYIDATKEVKGEATYSIAGFEQTLKLDTTRTASGVGGILGLDYRPNPQLTFALRYESVTELEFEADTSVNDFQITHYSDGDKERLDLPPVLGLGVAYAVDEKISLSLSAHYFFINSAKDEADGTNPLGQPIINNYDDDYSDGFELTGGGEYKLMDTLKLSLGYQYTSVGGGEKTYRDLDYTLDSHFIGGGAKWTAMENLDIVFGMGRVFYVEGNDESGAETFNKAVWAFALSGEMRF